MNLHILTPVIRPAFLSAIAASLEAAMKRAPAVAVFWHVLPELGHQNILGTRLRNQMIDRIGNPGEWVWLLDDDTLVHPALLERMDAHRGGNPQAECFVFGQTRPAGWHSGEADPDRMMSGHRRPAPDADVCLFDTGQWIATRGFIGDYRLTETRDFDGLIWEELLQPRKHEVVFVPETLSFFNALRPAEFG